MLYSLGVGLGENPLDKHQLKYVYADEGMEVFPTMPVVLCHPGPWTSDPTTGIDRVRQVHGQQGIEIHRHLPISGTIRGKTKVTGIVDKGVGRGALIYTERELFDVASNELVATLTSTSFCRGNGGFNGPTYPVKPVHLIPERVPDHIFAWTTLRQAALIYRLSGDFNALHADPAYAARAGYAQPILHGLATFALGAWAVMNTYTNAQVDKLMSFDARFSAPVTPGETISFDLWRDGPIVSLRAWSRERLVLDNGKAVLG
jgi:acyl dehydratase